MDISLPPELARYVQDKIRSGAFASADEVVRAALDSQRLQEEITQEDVKELRALVAVGLDQANRGLSEPWDAAQIKAKLRNKLA